MKYFDLHVHSKYSSDGVLRPEEIIKIAIKKGLNGVAITDHNTIKGGICAKKYETDDFEVIVGSEIFTDRGDVIGLFLSEEIKSRQFHDVISEVKEQDGIIVIPHPFDELRHSSFHPEDCDVGLIDCIEIFNSRCICPKYNDKAIEFKTKHRLNFTGGSDAHFSNEIGNAGIITKDINIRKSIANGDIEIFGKTCSIANHLGTKILKFKRKFG